MEMKLDPCHKEEASQVQLQLHVVAALSLMCHAAEWYNTKNVMVLLVSLYIVEMLDGLL